MRLDKECKDLLSAMSLTQAGIKPPKKDSKSDQFGGYEYASLSEVVQKIKEAARKNGLVIIQSIDTHPITSSNHNETTKITTTITTPGTSFTLNTVVAHHPSGQQLTTIVKIPLDKDTAQGLGSGITYMRKYQLLSIFMLAPIDDDGQGASGNDTPRSGGTSSGGTPPSDDGIPPPEEPPDLPGVTVEYVIEELGRVVTGAELKKVRDKYRPFMATHATHEEKKLAKTLIKSKQEEFKE